MAPSLGTDAAPSEQVLAGSGAGEGEGDGGRLVGARGKPRHDVIYRHEPGGEQEDPETDRNGDWSVETNR